MVKRIARIISIAIVAIMVLTALPLTSLGANTALKLTVPSGVSLTLYQYYSTSGTAISPSSKTTTDGITTYTFNGLASGRYCYKVSGSGYYTVKKNIYYTAAEAATGQTIDCNPGKKAGNGFEPNDTVKLYSDEVMSTILNSDPNQAIWKDYKYLFSTPALTTDRAEHQQTTQEEMMTFIGGLDDAGDNMYVYSAGKSPVYNYDIPVVVYTTTDLSGADTLEDAAALVRANGKPTVHYQGQIHSNEPGGGEGALAMLIALDGEYGADVLKDVNVYVIPRYNVDGAYNNSRYNTSDNMDMNRDQMWVETDEVKAIHNVYNLFMPEVAIDGHEYDSSSVDSASGVCDDFEIDYAGILTHGEDYISMSQELYMDIYNAGVAAGLRPYNYGSEAGTSTYVQSKAYYGLRGSISFLVETRGIYFGMAWMERRIMSQAVPAMTIISYTAENAKAVKDTIAAVRSDLISKGAVYGEEGDVIMLDHATSQTDWFTLARPTFSMADGTMTDAGTGKKIYIQDTITQSRTRPTAYIMPKDAENIDRILENMTVNGVEYYEVPAGTMIQVQQYKGDKSSASLLEEKIVTFEKGAYIFTMNQASSAFLALSMEPDPGETDGYNGSLVQAGIVHADEDGLLPIYRHIHNLDANGKVTLVTLESAPTGLSVTQPASKFGTGTITGLDASKLYEYRGEGDEEYTAVPAGSTQITGLEIGPWYVRFAATATSLYSHDAVVNVIDSALTDYVVYLDPANGNDANHGRTDTAAVKTLERAYKVISRLLASADANTEGTITFVSDLTLSGYTRLPEHDYTVVLTGKTATVGIKSAYDIKLNGPTRLENVSVSLTTGAVRYIDSNGYKLVIGENVTSNATGVFYYSLSGGTNLTVNSGTWRNVTASNYTGKVQSEVKANNASRSVYDSNSSGSLEILLFGTGVLDNFNAGQTLVNMIKTTSGMTASVVSGYNGHSSTVAFNMYELFPESVRDNPNDYTLGSGGTATSIKNRNASSGFDLVVLQTGRDQSIKFAKNASQDVLAGIKLIKMCYDANPNVKILLLAPYGYHANLSYFTETTIANHTEHLAAIDKQAIEIFDGAKAKVPNVNMEIAFVGDLFEVYNSDVATTQKEMFREATAGSALGNPGNRATPRGSYLTACVMYSVITDQSPIGVKYYGYSSSTANGTLSKEEALEMQKLAAMYVRGEESDATVDIFDQQVALPEAPEIKDIPTGTQVKANNASKAVYDSNKNNKLDVLLVGAGVIDNFNTGRTTVKLLADKLDLPSVVTPAFMGHNTTYVYNMYEMFSKADDPSDYTLANKSNPNAIKAQLEGDGYDLVILQVGRDYSSLNPTTSRVKNIYSAMKLAKLAYDKNPDVKILILAPYGYMADFSWFNSSSLANHTQHVAAINAEAIGVFDELVKVAPKANVEVAFVSDLFEGYHTNHLVTQRDLFRQNDNQSSTKNVGNRANEQGSYLTACVMYALLMDESPVGIKQFGYTYSTVTADLSKAETLRMQKIAEKFVFGTVSDATLDIYEEKLPDPPAVKDIPTGTKVKENTDYLKSVADYNKNGKLDVFLWGSGVIDNYNTGRTVLKLLQQDLNIETSTVTGFLGHAEGGTFNMYELFAKAARGEPDDYTMGTGDSAKNFKAQIEKDGFDLLILQVGRDYTSRYPTDSGAKNIISAAKVAKMAYDVNPNVKILLLSPYGYAADFSWFTDAPAVNSHTSHLARINAEANDMFNAIVGKVPKANVQVAYVGDLFEGYYSDNFRVTQRDLFRTADNSVASHTNPGNRANEQGSYLTACVMYAVLTGKSPVGLPVYGYSGSSINQGLSKEETLRMQQIAEKFVFGTVSTATTEVYDSVGEIVTGYNLTMQNGSDGDIGVSLNILMNHRLLNDENAYISIKVGDGEEMKVTFGKNGDLIPDANGKVKLITYLSAKQMTDVIEVSVFNGNGKGGDIYKYSVKQYCTDYMTLYPNDTALNTYLKALLNYGAAAQKYFSYKTDDLANADLSDSDKDLSSVAVFPEVSGAQRGTVAMSGTSLTDMGISAYSATIIHKDKATVRHYFKLNEGQNIADFTFAFGSSQAEVSELNGEYYVDSDAVWASEITGTPVVLRITKGEQSASINYGTRDYIIRLFDKYNGTEGKEKTIDLVRAMYVYGKTAAEYFAG